MLVFTLYFHIMKQKQMPARNKTTLPIQLLLNAIAHKLNNVNLRLCKDCCLLLPTNLIKSSQLRNCILLEESHYY